MAAWVAAGGSRLVAADDPGSSAEKERKLIGVLRSDAAPQEKAITCKRLAVYGSKEAVPVLAPLLSDEKLSSWARIALEAIPDPAADDALREALGKLQGRLLIGVINSIGTRRDPKATDGLVAQLKQADPEVAAAAAEALGHVGGDRAAQALEQALASAQPGLRSAVAEGCLLCADRFLAEGNPAPAMRLYDTVRKANVPTQRQLEAIRGAILARRSDGLPLLLEQLRSPGKAQFGIGLHTARELPGKEVSTALAAEISRTSAERQGPLLLALADRHDDAVLPAVLEAAKSGSKNLRLVALGILDRLGNLSCVPVLLDAAADADVNVAQAAKVALVRLEGGAVDADLLSRLSRATGKMREVLIELAGQRRIRAALGPIVSYAGDADAGVRRAAVDAIGALGDAPQVADLVRLLQKTMTPKERSDLEKALVAIGSRTGAQCVPHLSPLVQSRDPALRAIAVRVMAAVGGSDALATVTKAVDDPDETVQDEAVRVLSTWPNNWPEDVAVAEPLLKLARSGKKLSHQVQGVRGYLQYVQEDKKLPDSEKLAKLNELLPVIQRPEEKRLVISALSSLPIVGALERLTSYVADPAVAEEACLAILKIAGAEQLKAAEARQKALQTVAEKSGSETTRKKAQQMLKAAE
jgi:HEAT repeat protein